MDAATLGKAVVAVLLLLQFASAALLCAGRPRWSFLLIAVAAFLVISFWTSGFTRETGSLHLFDVLFLSTQALAFLLSTAGIRLRPSVSLFWPIWSVNLLTTLFFLYMAVSYGVF